MRVLMTVAPVPSHFLPMVPLAWELRAAGHEVVVAVQPDVLETVRSAGLNAVVLGDWCRPVDLIRDALPPGQRMIHTSPQTAQKSSFVPVPWVERVRRLAPDYVDFARRFCPDLVLADPFEFISLVVGGALGVPVVQHRWGVDELSRAKREGIRPLLRETCRAAAVEELPEPDLVLDPCPPSLQVPEADPARLVRPVAYNGGGTIPEWLWRGWGPSATAGAGASGEKPPARVLVALGTQTLALNGVPLMRTLLEACASIPEAEAYAVVDARYREEAGTVPDNVRLIDPLPLNQIVPECTAVVHHAGAGTVTTCLAYGLPQVALPQLADQFACAARLAATGAGVALNTPTEQDDPACVADALGRVLRQPHWGARARELGAEMAGMPSLDEVVRDLEELTATWPRGSAGAEFAGAAGSLPAPQ